MENILNKVNSTVDEKITDEKLIKINNIALELEKAMINLAATSTEEGENDFDLEPIPAKQKN